MSRPKMLPDDVRQICIQIVRGYDRRVRDYYNRRRDIIDGTPSRYETITDTSDPKDWEKSTRFYSPSSHSASRTGEDKTMQLLGLEELPETKRMRAVAEAKQCIGLDLPSEMRAKLVDAIMLNCRSGRQYPYEYLDVEGIGRTDFYARRTRFLMDIATRLDLI